jgi:hypothetical protein
MESSVDFRHTNAMKAKVIRGKSHAELEEGINLFMERNPQMEIRFFAQSECFSSMDGRVFTATILYSERRREYL